MRKALRKKWENTDQTNSVLGHLSTVFLLLQVSWSNMQSSSISHALTGSDFTINFYCHSKIKSLKKVISASNNKINIFIFQESYHYTSNWFYHCVKSVQIRTFFWSVFSRISIECGGLRSKSPYSVRIRENTDQKNLCIWTLLTQCILYIVTKLVIFCVRHKCMTPNFREIYLTKIFGFPLYEILRNS